MRGLKHFCLNREHHGHKVASFTDAWIETREQEVAETTKLSHLLQMRGLKHQYFVAYFFLNQSHLLQMRGLKRSSDARLQRPQVASFTDAWIETLTRLQA